MFINFLVPSTHKIVCKLHSSIAFFVYLCNAHTWALYSPCDCSPLFFLIMDDRSRLIRARSQWALAPRNRSLIILKPLSSLFLKVLSFKILKAFISLAWFEGSSPAEVDGFFHDVKILSTSPPGGTLSRGSRVWDFRLVKELQAWKNRPLSKI